MASNTATVVHDAYDVETVQMVHKNNKETANIKSHPNSKLFQMRRKIILQP